MMGALVSYPELGCTGGPYEIPCKWGVFPDVLCGGNDRTLQFAKDVLKASVIIKLSVSYSVTQMWQRHLICTFILISIKRNGVLTV